MLKEAIWYWEQRRAAHCLALTAAVVPWIVLLTTPRFASAERAAPDPSEVRTPDSTLANPKARWRLSGLRPEIRGRIHLTASKVPRFPHEDPRLLDPRKWPETMVIGVETCSLRIESQEWDYSRIVRSMDDVTPRSGYSLTYYDPRTRKTRGPAYHWTATGALVERSWRGGGSHSPETFLNMFYPTGELFRFERRSNGYNETGDARRADERLEEVFARNGTLIGCGYLTRRGAADPTFIGYWLGMEVGYRELQDRTFQAQRTVNRWYPTRPRGR